MQDLTAQYDALTGLGVAPERISVDHGLTGTNRQRPGAVRGRGGVPGWRHPVGTKLERIARSLLDAARSSTT